MSVGHRGAIEMKRMAPLKQGALNLTDDQELWLLLRDIINVEMPFKSESEEHQAWVTNKARLMKLIGVGGFDGPNWGERPYCYWKYDLGFDYFPMREEQTAYLIENDLLLPGEQKQLDKERHIRERLKGDSLGRSVPFQAGLSGK